MGDEEGGDTDGNVDTALGFMFDAVREKVEKQYVIGSFKFVLAAIDDQPGSFQSGQYLWPAAETLAHRILSDKEWEDVLVRVGGATDKLQVVELGSGVGLGGLAASKRTQVDRVVMTDYDPGAVALIESNVVLNNAGEKCAVVQCEWGASAGVLPVSALVVGSDLIYATEVVEPLLKTVHQCLPSGDDARGGLFVLVSSFDIGDESNAKFAKVASRLGLAIEEVVPLNYTENIHRVQYLYRRSP